jgi:lauroyl/myristoyl acyltransferase
VLNWPPPHHHASVRSTADALDIGGQHRETATPPRWYVHPYNRVEFYRLATAMGWLPRNLRLALAQRVGWLAARLLPRERAVIGKTLGVVTGATGGRLAALTSQVFAEFAMCFSDLVSMGGQPPDRFPTYVAAPTGVERFHALKGGMISLTAHVGNWDLAGRLLAQHGARPTHVVVAVEEARALEPWLRRNALGVRFVPRARPTVSLGLLAALRRGEAVALQGDRALGNRGDVWVPFFGRPAPFPIGPFHLARATGVPIVPAFCTLEADYRYSVTVVEPLAVGPGGEEDALRGWVAILEGAVRERPTQWFNFFDIWSPFGA